MAKARVTPIAEAKRLTIPRLELMGAVIACRLIKTTRVATQLTETNPATIWIDSQCVLSWIKTSHTIPTFVRNRVSEIRKVPNVEFRYVPTNTNIADLPTHVFESRASGK